MSFFDFEEVEPESGSNWRQTLHAAPAQPFAAPIRPTKSTADWARDVASPQNGYPSLQQSTSGYQPCNFGNASTVRNIAGTNSNKKPKLDHSNDSITIDDNSDGDISCTPQSLPPSAAPSPRANPAPQMYTYPSNGGFQQYCPQVSTSQSPFGTVPMVSGSNARLPSQAISRSQQPNYANQPKQNSKKRKGDVVDLTLSSDDSNAGSADSDLQITGSKAAEVMVDNSHQFLGQISSVVLILNPVPELNMEAKENQIAPPPLHVSFNRTPPVSIPMQKPKESVYISSNESGQRFGALEARVADILGPVLGGKPCMDGRVVVRGYAMRLGKQAVTVRSCSRWDRKMLMVIRSPQSCNSSCSSSLFRALSNRCQIISLKTHYGLKRRHSTTKVQNAITILITLNSDKQKPSNAGDR